MRKVTLIGKGNLTEKQSQALKNYLGDFEIVEQHQVLQSPKDIQQKPDAVVTLIFIPQVIATLNTYKKFNPDTTIIAFQTQQIGEFESIEQAKEAGADIWYQKTYQNGKTKIIGSKTVKMLINPKINITYEEEIPL